MEKIKLGNSPEIMRRAKTRQKLAAYIGASPDTMKKQEAIVERAETNPERLAHILKKHG